MESMRISELEKYAQENGFDSIRFQFTNFQGRLVSGKWIDAWFGFFRLDGMPEDQFITTKQFLELLGDSIEFEIL